VLGGVFKSALGSRDPGFRLEASWVFRPFKGRLIPVFAWGTAAAQPQNWVCHPSEPPSQSSPHISPNPRVRLNLRICSKTGSKIAFFHFNCFLCYP
jgi:hypothetical protein